MQNVEPPIYEVCDCESWALASEPIYVGWLKAVSLFKGRAPIQRKLFQLGVIQCGTFPRRSVPSVKKS